MERRLLFLYHAAAWCILIGPSTAHLSFYGPGSPLEGFRAPPGSVWPKPVTWYNNTNLMTLDPKTFAMTSDVLGCDVLDDAMQRYGIIIDLDSAGVIDPALTLLTQLSISVVDHNCAADYYPSFDMDESYNLDVTSSETASLTANTIWGALRGFETFSQLVHLTDTKMYHINQTSISDYPRYSYRGILIDSSRHFLSVQTIRDVLNAASWDKFNVLHWHIVDDQSFPYPSRVYPELAIQGAYTQYHRYSAADVTNIIEYARLRGIRVIPEFDTPGHTYSWGRSHPELLTPCWGQGEEGGPYVPEYPYHSEAEVINPMVETTFDFMDAFFQEIVEDFPDSYIHLGMDEAYYNCWASNPNMTDWMTQMGFTDYYQVEEYYDSRLVDIMQQKGAGIIIWQDPLDNGGRVPLNAIVEIWKDWFWEEAMADYTTLGYNTLLSAPWYLNYISYGEDWQYYYNIEPESFTTNETLWEYVQGGEACMWGEFVDGTNILERLWPRVSTVAERLWSPKTENNTETAKFRLDEHRCRYMRRGFPAQPLMNGYCGDYEWNNPV